MRRNRADKPPSGLSREASALWCRITDDYGLSDDAAGEQLLLSLCQTLDRLRECQRAVKTDGLTITGSQGQIRPHPLLQVEAECRRALLAHYRALKLEPEDY